MTTNEDFGADWDKLHEKLGWLLPVLEQEEGIAGKEAFLGDAKEFLGRWDSRTSNTISGECVAKLKVVVISMDRRLQLLFCEDLHNVIMEQLDCHNAEDDFQLTAKACSGDSAALARMKWVNGFDLSKPFNGQAEFRRMDAAFKTQEENYAHVLARLKSDWPDRFTATMRQRLARAESNDLCDWGEDLKVERFDLKVALKASTTTVGGFVAH